MKSVLAIMAIMIPIAAAICFVLAWPFMWLWNYAMVKAVTVCQPITYWPAFWLMILISMFFLSSSSGKSKD